MAVFNGWRLTRAGVVFVVGIIVLALVVFGVIMFVRERGEQARRDEAIAVAEQNLEAQSEVSTAQTADDENTDSETTPAQASPATPAPATPTAPQAAQLPETGIESVAPIIILAIVTLAISYYVTSRRTVRDL